MRKIHIANEKKRDAEVGYEMNTAKRVVRLLSANGGDCTSVQVLKTTCQTDLAALQTQTPDPVALGEALIVGDPEVDMEQFGRKLEGLHKVYATMSGDVAYGVTLQEHVHAPDGTEKEVRPITEVAANITLENLPIRWTGKMLPRKDVIRKFVFARSYQLRHVNGLTYDFLFEMAKKLADAKAMMLMGAGEKGNGPLVFNANGKGYRGFLEGRVDGEKYMLILHLTNLELKELPNE